MTTDRTTALRELAKAATPGPWKDRPGYPADRFEPDGYRYVQFGPTERKADGKGTDQLAAADAAYIAAMSPDVTLTLLARLERAEAVVEAARAHVALWDAFNFPVEGAFKPTFDKMRAALDSAASDD